MPRIPSQALTAHNLLRIYPARHAGTHLESRTGMQNIVSERLPLRPNARAYLPAPLKSLSYHLRPLPSREIAADIGPQLKRVQLQLDTLETQLNLAIMARYAELSSRPPGETAR